MSTVSSGERTWPPPTGSPVGTSGWFRASDGEWYQSIEAPAPGYVLGQDGRWRPVASATEAEREEVWRWSGWGLGDVAWGALVFVVSGLIGGLVLIASTGGSDELDEIGVYGNSAFIVLNALALLGVPWWATRHKGLRSLRADFGLRVRPADIGIGLGIGFAALIAAGIVASSIDAALDVEEATSNLPVDGLDGVGQVIVFVLATAVLTPIIEELFFRGLLYRSMLKRGSSVGWSIAATTAIFTAPHLLAAESWQSAVTLTATIAVLGAGFNLACHVTNNRLAAPIIAHAVVNGVAVIALA